MAAQHSNDVLKSMQIGIRAGFFWNEEVLKSMQNDANIQVRTSLLTAIKQASMHFARHKTVPPNLEMCKLRDDRKLEYFENKETAVRFYFERVHKSQVFCFNINSKITKKITSYVAYAQLTDEHGRLFYIFLTQGHLQILLADDLDAVLGFMIEHAQKIELPNVCVWCGKKPTKLQTCSGCNITKYCDKECQLAHYANGHKNCKKVIKEMEEADAATVQSTAADEQSAAADEQVEPGAIHDALANMSLDEGVAKRRGD